ELARLLSRPVHYAMTPGGMKDVRAWAAAQGLQGNDLLDLWHLAGERLLAELSRLKRVPPAAFGERKTEAEPVRFRFMDSAEFLAGDYRAEFLVPRILVRGQPAVIGGASKTLKTSVVLDLAVSMATATPFLGTFPVNRRTRIGIASGESGEFT